MQQERGALKLGCRRSCCCYRGEHCPAGCSHALQPTAADLTCLTSCSLISGPACHAGPITTPGATALNANTGYEPNGTLENSAWDYVSHVHPNVNLSGRGWSVDSLSKYPADRSQSSQKGATLTYNFTGSEVGACTACSLRQPEQTCASTVMLSALNATSGPASVWHN